MVSGNQQQTKRPLPRGMLTGTESGSKGGGRGGEMWIGLPLIKCLLLDAESVRVVRGGEWDDLLRLRHASDKHQIVNLMGLQALHFLAGCP